MQTIGHLGMWLGFGTVVLVMLAIDLFAVGGGKQQRMTMRAAATWSAIWVGVSLLFAGILWWYVDQSQGRAMANDTALKFMTCTSQDLI